MGSNRNEANASGVSWSAVFAGGATTAALALILLALGTGLGLSSISVWSNTGASATTIGAAAIIWLIAMEIISSSLGGYLAGRLRTKWATIHTDEVYFRRHGARFFSVVCGPHRYGGLPGIRKRFPDGPAIIIDGGPRRGLLSIARRSFEPQRLFS